MAFCADRLAASLSALDGRWQGGAYAVALSGGLDSTVLLHAMARVARDQGVSLRALHVDHGLQPQSAEWTAACRAACSALGVPLEVVPLRLAPVRGESVEALAREARYAALAGRLAPDEWLLTAHHRDDQLETVLIQLLRGAGVAGLAAMPARARFGRGWHARPLLGIDRADLAAYGAAHGLAWVEDPMNAEDRFDRAWLRNRVLPQLRERWPSAAATVARSAAHAAEAAAILAEVAEADAQALLDEGRLSLDGLAGLSPARQTNVVRGWLRRQGLRCPPAARLAAALRAFRAARPDGSPALRWAGGEIRRYRGRLYALRPLPPRPPGGSLGTDPMALGPGQGLFGLVPSDTGGLVPDVEAAASIAFRGGGESLRPEPGRPRKRLKDLCQEAGIVPWMRDRLPLVIVDGRLAAVADLWVDVDFAVPAGRAALRPVWRDRPLLY